MIEFVPGFTTPLPEQERELRTLLASAQIKENKVLLSKQLRNITLLLGSGGGNDTVAGIEGAQINATLGLGTNMFPVPVPHSFLYLLCQRPLPKRPSLLGSQGPAPWRKSP